MGVLTKWSNYVRKPAKLPSRTLLAMVLLGVFFIFSLVGFLFELGSQRPLSLVSACISASFGGVYAVGYAFSISSRKFWLVPFVIAGQVWLGPFIWQKFMASGLVTSAMQTDQASTKNTIIFIAISCMTIGFTLIMTALRVIGDNANQARAEMLIAARVHQELVPELAIQKKTHTIVGFSKASSAMGGDLIDVLDAGDSTHIIVADISGHGIGPALLMGMLKSAIRTRVQYTQHDSQSSDPLALIASDITRTMESQLPAGSFATLVWLKLNAQASTELLIAGHPPMIIIPRLGTPRAAEGTNPLIGLGLPGDQLFTSEKLVLQSGDIVVLYTDGLIEARSKSYRYLGVEGLMAIAASHIQSLDENARTNPSTLRAAAEQIVAACNTGRVSDDDQSIVLLAWK
jgi:hypothetical protein